MQLKNGVITCTYPQQETQALVADNWANGVLIGINKLPKYHGIRLKAQDMFAGIRHSVKRYYRNGESLPETHVRYLEAVLCKRLLDYTFDLSVLELLFSICREEDNYCVKPSNIGSLLFLYNEPFFPKGVSSAENGGKKITVEGRVFKFWDGERFIVPE